MKKLIVLEPEVYEKLKNKHKDTDKKVLSQLDAKMEEILTFNRPDSEKVTLYNEALQKPKLFLKNFQPKTTVKKPLSESTVLKRFKKQTKAKKLFKDATSKKNLDWNEDGQVLLDDRVVLGSHIDDLFQFTLKKRDPTLPGAREFESMLWESV